MRRSIIAAALVTVSLAGSVVAYRAYLVDQLRRPVLALLSDPDSAQFRSERLFSGWTLDNSALCGEVNTRNRMGGYVGYAHFTVVAEIASISDEFETDFKLKNNLPLCGFESTPTPWWHLRW